MDEDGAGPLLARGRAADVFAAGPRSVLRRYRDPMQNAEPEAAVMSYLRAAGYPVPQVESAQGRDLVMERVDGPTMLSDLRRRPWLLRRYAVVLARLHTRLGEIPAPPQLRAPLGAGASMLHLDLHPDNVLLTADGPVVIDWTNAARGPAAVDVADTWLLVGCARADTRRRGVELLAAAASWFTREFVRAAGADAARPYLSTAYAHRSANPNMSAAELSRMRALVRRQTGSDPGPPF